MESVHKVVRNKQHNLYDYFSNTANELLRLGVGELYSVRVSGDPQDRQPGQPGISFNGSITKFRVFFS